jgi:hypothetical protein
MGNYSLTVIYVKPDSRHRAERIGAMVVTPKRIEESPAIA